MPLNIFDMIDSVIARPRALWQVPARMLEPSGSGRPLILIELIRRDALDAVAAQ
jgi:hypothetical protein